MLMARPFVSVYSVANPSEKVGQEEMPEVCASIIRPDHVQYIHTQMAKNARQAYAVKPGAGYQSSAESWGTGRAVARIPRVAGGGTHRAGQGAFGNMCRGGGMYAPTRIWRRWHRKINLNERRMAVVSALSGCAVASLVMARGHKIDAIPEIPCVVDDNVEKFEKTKEAIRFLRQLGCGEELDYIKDSRMRRSGQSKWRGRKYRTHRGPLIIYAGTKDAGRAFQNIPGVESCHVSRLNLLTLAPGGNLGRFLIFSQSAFRELSAIWGGINGGGSKKGYTLPKPVMTFPDLARIINSDEIQSVLNPKKMPLQLPSKGPKPNPLKNKAAREKLNPALKVKKTASK